MSGNRIRSQIYQANFVSQDKDAWITLSTVIGIIAGFISGSPLTGFGIICLLFAASGFGFLRKLLACIFALIPSLFIAAMFIANNQYEWAFVSGFIIYSGIYVTLRNSMQYWYELEKDGGPWSD